MSDTRQLQTTVLTEVPPGDETGVYYITLCNLPFDSSWQDLKDFIRSACTVEHVEIFETSTSGWVRVRGKENFEKAWNVLNNGVFHGRRLIASDKNRTQSIKIKQPTYFSANALEGNPHQPPQLQPTQSYPAQNQSSQHQVSTSSQHSSAASSYRSPQYISRPVDQPAYPLSHAYHAQMTGYSTGGVTTSLYNTVPAAIAYPTPQGLYAGNETGYSYPGTAMGVVEQPINASYLSIPAYQDAQYTIPYRQRADLTTYDTSYSDTPSSGYVTTEPRKVFIKQISQRAKIKDVTDWIRRQGGSIASEIVEIDVPQHDEKKCLRGHAFVILQSSSAAREAVEIYDQSLFQGRKVSARLTVEGLTASNTVPSLKEKNEPRKEDAKGRHDGSSKGKEKSWGKNKQKIKEDKSKEASKEQNKGKSSEKPKDKPKEKPKESPKENPKENPTAKDKGKDKGMSARGYRHRSSHRKESSSLAPPLVANGSGRPFPTNETTKSS